MKQSLLSTVWIMYLLEDAIMLGVQRKYDEIYCVSVNLPRKLLPVIVK
jgi:hypothetical protein